MTRVTLLAGFRVVDLSEGIAGPYASKLLADAGADVIKVERAGGDPLRRWSASHTDLGGTDGALFRYLNSSKQSVVGSWTEPAVAALLDDADLLLEGGDIADEELGSLRRAHSQLSVVSITPFGRTGPWAGRPATEFTLQALSGSTASRGLPEREPLHAGGRLGEWIAGTYAALAGLAVLRGDGADHVDVSMLECMSITLCGFTALYAGLAGALDAAKGFPGPFRSLEMPSIVPTKDGLVGFCTGTGQQFEDFLLMIERPDLRGDDRFHTARRRIEHHAEFLEMVEAWSTTRTTEEIIDYAGLLRIPVAPVGTPASIPTFEQFVARRVFEPNPDGAFIQPRPPYCVEGVDGRPQSPAPGLGEHTGTARWAARPVTSAPASTAEGAAVSDRLPLDGVRVIDLTAFWAGPSATQMLAALGADVIKIESIQRPDGMRFSSSKSPADDRWWEWSAYYQSINTNKRTVTLDLGSEQGRSLAFDLIDGADGVIENYSPRVLDGFGITWAAIHARNPKAIMIRMPGFGLDGPWRDRTGFAQTMEQASGMAWVSGFADDLPVIPRGPCDPLAGMHTVFAFLAAMAERDRTGTGRFVEVSMIEAALAVAAEVVIERSAYGRDLQRAGNRGPVAAPQGLYPCRGTEQWLALAVADDDQWDRLVTLLGAPAWSLDPTLTTASGRRAAHDAIDDRLRSWCADRDVDEVAEELVAAGIAAAPVVSPMRVLDLAHLRQRGFVEHIEHAVVGGHDIHGVPFRLASHDGPWFRTPAPTLGQHNVEVLGGILGLSDTEIERLSAAEVIGDRMPR